MHNSKFVHFDSVLLQTKRQTN